MDSPAARRPVEGCAHRDLGGQGKGFPVAITDVAGGRHAVPRLREARRLGDFEGYVSWGLGLARPSCKRMFTLRAPTRLVIDVPH